MTVPLTSAAAMSAAIDAVCSVLTHEGTGVDLVATGVVVVGVDTPVVEATVDTEVVDAVETGVAAENRPKEGSGLKAGWDAGGLEAQRGRGARRECRGIEHRMKRNSNQHPLMRCQRQSSSHHSHGASLRTEAYWTW